MALKDIIAYYENVIIQIATPYSIGTGFYIKKYDLIVTNEHVVRGNKKVVIAGKQFEKQLTEIIFLDAKYDIALLRPPLNHTLEEISFKYLADVKEGDTVLAIGHPFDLKCTTVQGIVSSLLFEDDYIKYVQHDAALNPGHSGGPLLDTSGSVIGINTFIIQKGKNIGFSLPIDYLEVCIKDYNLGSGNKGVRCLSCNNISFEDDGKTTQHCPKCGATINMISDTAEYEPYGFCIGIEEMISMLGYSVALARRGPNNWSIKNGSATVNISYYEKVGLLVGDVYMCTLPENNKEALYKYLLKQNFILQGLSFSVKDQDVILSLLIYDQYINSETMFKLFKSLLDTADQYDNYLVENFGAKWKK